MHNYILFLLLPKKSALTKCALKEFLNTYFLSVSILDSTQVYTGITKSYKIYLILDSNEQKACNLNTSFFLLIYLCSPWTHYYTNIVS